MNTLMKKTVHIKQQKALQGLLKMVRNNCGLSQVELATRLGKPQSFVSKIEAGERRLDLPELQQVCIALGIALEDFVRRYVVLTKYERGGE